MRRLLLLPFVFFASSLVFAQSVPPIPAEARKGMQELQKERFVGTVHANRFPGRLRRGAGPKAANLEAGGFLWREFWEEIEG